MLVGASRRAALLGGVLRLAAPAPMMATVLRLTGLDSRFEIFATVSEAIGAVAHPGRRESAMSKPGACWPDQHTAAGQFQVPATPGDGQLQVTESSS